MDVRCKIAQSSDVSFARIVSSIFPLARWNSSELEKPHRESTNPDIKEEKNWCTVELEKRVMIWKPRTR